MIKLCLPYKENDEIQYFNFFAILDKINNIQTNTTLR